MLGLMGIMCGIAIAIKAMDVFRTHEGSDKAVESTTNKAVDCIDKLFK